MTMDTVDKAKVKAEESYAVTLSRPIQVGPRWLRPGQDVTLKGKVIKDNADAVDAVYRLPA